ncbi:gephyrin-like molybdotransferase Glp [Malikia spinosa]|uniref:Molybdopterin molybdenumtransferase n=1 Tax=Malikia spinosa TaxID=86180 RepID=A0A7C9MY30_9BURK|nr:gephyrin-like molybdotransferase Glp [Malikia spinosa]MYZ52841.1 molybdopterin molybdotransferase MoeA [Malikia spinosa]
MKTLDQIAAELQGYDPNALPADAVDEFLSRLVEPVTQTERVGLFDALDRVLAADLIAPLSVPPHDNSAMDGFALAGAQLQTGQGLALRVVGTAYAGAAWQGEVGPGQCVKIMTGAVMPAGLDTVVPLELTRIEGEFIQIPADALRAGDNRRLLGEDLMAGQPALLAGSRLGPAALGLIASLGLAEVTVWRRPKVAFFSTGDEILSLGQPPREGAVYDSNRYTLFGLLKRLGVELIDLGAVPDRADSLEAAFRQAASMADAVITSGGVSVGEADHTKAVMRQLGDMAFWRIAMRPGRPMAVGRLQQAGRSALLFGLPGNPVAVMVTFLAFVRPALLRLMGASQTQPLRVTAHSEEAMRKKPGRTEFQRGVASRTADGSLQVRSTGSQGSGVLRSMAEANCLIRLDHDQGNVAIGDPVELLLFDGLI